MAARKQTQFNAPLPTVQDLQGMTTADLLALYNRLSGKTAIKEFHSRAKGLAQCAKLLDAAAAAPELDAALAAAGPVHISATQAKAAVDAGKAAFKGIAKQAHGKAAKSADAPKRGRKPAADPGTVYTVVENKAKRGVFLDFCNALAALGKFTQAQALAATAKLDTDAHLRRHFAWARSHGIVAPV